VLVGVNMTNKAVGIPITKKPAIEAKRTLAFFKNV